jgi:PKD repeat protein
MRLFLFYSYILLLFFSFTDVRAQAPTITSVTPGSVCQGGSVTITGSNFTGATEVWLGSVQAAGFNVVNDGTITAFVANNANTGVIKVVTPGGSANSASNLNILFAPKPALADKNEDGPFTNCNGDLTYEITVVNQSVVAGSNNQYTISWGDGTPNFTATDWPPATEISHTYGSQGNFNIVLSITPANGCSRSVAYPFYNGQNPLASFTTTNSTTGLCTPSDVEFQIGNWAGNSPGTKYEIDFGDGSTKVVLQHPLNATGATQRITHTYTRSSCPAIDFTATLKAINGCFTTTYTLDQIIIRQKPKADFDAPSTVCISDAVTFRNLSTAGYSGNTCSSTTNYLWDFGDGTTYNQKTPPPHQYVHTGTFTVTLSASNLTCGSDIKTMQIVVLPISPPPTVSVTNISYCQNDISTPLSATGVDLHWYLGGTLLAGPPTPPTTSTTTLTYYVSQTLPNSCESQLVPITVKINAPPARPGVTPLNLCLNQTTSPLTATGVNLLWYTTSSSNPGSSTPPTPSTSSTGTTSYFVSQTVNSCEGQRAQLDVTVYPLAQAPVVSTPITYCQYETSSRLTANGTNLLWYTTSTGGTGSSTAPIPSTSTYGSTIYYVSQTTLCGEGPRAAITVNVSPAPNASITYSPSTVCNTTSTSPVPVTFTGTSGGTYTISPSIGLPIDAVTGTISPAGATAGVYTIRYTVAGAAGCSTFTTTTQVTVNTTPNASITYGAICTADPATAVTLTGTRGGTFSSTMGLTINSSTGAITPGSSTPGIYTVNYDIAAAPPCPGLHTTATVTITQAPAATISYPANVCNAPGTPATTVTLTGTSGGTFSISPTGLPIDAVTGTITPDGAPTGTYTIRYLMRGSGGCRDVTATAIVTVNKAPVANISYSPICTADPVTNVILTGSRGGTFSSTSGLTINSVTGAITPGSSIPGTYTINYDIAAAPPCPGLHTTATVTITKAPAATISYPATVCNATNTVQANVTLTGTSGGTFSISPTGLPIDPTTGTITPARAPTGTYTIKYIMHGSGGCKDVTATASVTVNKAPDANISYGPICTADPVTNVTLVGNIGGTFSSTPGLTINSVTGAITPGSSIPDTYTVNYDIAAAPPCPGLHTTTTVTITQAPAATISYPATVCNATGTPANAVTLTGTPNGTFSISPTGLQIDAVTGTITPEKATPGSYTIMYLLHGSGGCKDVIATAYVTVNAAPTATINYNGSPYCGLQTSQPVTLTGNKGGLFSADAGLSINSNTGDINPSASTPGTYTVTYTIAAMPPCPGYVTTTQVVIIESPVITFVNASQAICSGETAVFTPSSSVANTNYQWAVNGALPAGINGITSGVTTGSISLSFTNTGSTAKTLQITVIPVNPTPISCEGKAYTLQLLVRPVVPSPGTDTAQFCMGMPGGILQATALPGNILHWFDTKMQPLNSAPFISTDHAARYTYYVSQQDVNGCESGKALSWAVVHATAKIISAVGKDPAECGIPSGSITLSILDLDDGPLPGIPVIVHYTKFQTEDTMELISDANGNITMPLTAGTYSKISVETIGSCVSQPIPDVFILKDPSPPAKPVVGYNPPVCTGTPLSLTALSATAGPLEYVWAGPAFGPTPDTSSNTVVTFPSAALDDAGTYVVYAIQHNCISLPASVDVKVTRGPVKPFINTRTPLCVGDELQLQASSSIPGTETLSYLWKGPGTGFPVDGPVATIDKVSVADAGIYTITVTSSNTGCEASTDTLIQIGDYPQVRFAEDTLTLPTGYKLQLQPDIVNATDPGVLPMQQFIWTPTEDLACTDALCEAPFVTVKNNVCYSVQATNIYGCSGSDTICIQSFCKGTQVFIPNGFAPTGNVPENRRFMIRATGIVTVRSFRVFNRWGKIVFERSNFQPNDPQFGWDGTINGKIADTGVYVYTAEVVCENGVTQPIKGNVTLF